jgi:uncharacterized protein with HEPN domain
MFMSERNRLHIERIKEELLFINKTVLNLSEEDFINDDLSQHAIAMSLITIGECANHLTVEFKQCHPEIEWVQITAVRNIAAHGYWQLNMKQIWKAIVDDIPKLNDFFQRL